MLDRRQRQMFISDSVLGSRKSCVALFSSSLVALVCLGFPEVLCGCGEAQSKYFEIEKHQIVEFVWQALMSLACLLPSEPRCLPSAPCSLLKPSWACPLSLAVCSSPYSLRSRNVLWKQCFAAVHCWCLHEMIADTHTMTIYREQTNAMIFVYQKTPIWPPMALSIGLLKWRAPQARHFAVPNSSGDQS